MRTIASLFKRMLKSERRAQMRPRNFPVSQEPQRLATDLNENLRFFRTVYKDCSDVVIREFAVWGRRKAALIYIDGLSNEELIDQQVMSSLTRWKVPEEVPEYELIVAGLPVSSQKEIVAAADAIHEIASGNVLLLIDREMRAISLHLTKWEKRAVEEPIAESVVRGPREGFTETLTVNTALLRRRIKSPALKIKSLEIGKYTRTEVVLAYIEGLADPDLIEEVMKRLNRIEIDGILEGGYIEELIRGNAYSPFPQVLATERPDVVAGQLLEGRVAIMVDCTPFVMVLPITLFSLLQSPEDYSQHYWAGTVVRWLRYLFFSIALIIPSAYVAILTYHQEMVPTALLLSMARSREEIPFPALVEALLMEVTLEALREAGLRLPKQVGAAVSIVGALVIGQAATSAGLVSAPMVMVVALTGIASFTIPRYPLGISLRMLRFPLMFLAGMLGLLGLVLGIIAIIVHLCALRSFGLPYLTPIAPFKARQLKDVLYRAPQWAMDMRPDPAAEGNEYRQPPGQKPEPIQGEKT